MTVTARLISSDSHFAKGLSLEFTIATYVSLDPLAAGCKFRRRDIADGRPDRRAGTGTVPTPDHQPGTPVHARQCGRHCPPGAAADRNS